MAAPIARAARAFRVGACSPFASNRFPARPGRLAGLHCRAAQAGFTGDAAQPDGQGGHPGQQEPSLRTSDADALNLKQPANAFSKLVAAYLHALDKHPVATKAVTSLVGFAIGDNLAQSIGGAPFDVLRTLRLSAYGLFIDGPVGHYFYQLLDKHVRPDDPRCAAAVLTKTALDQLLWAPAMTCVFLAVITTLEGRPEAALGVIQAKLFSVMLANFSVWPLAHLFNFRFVPPEQRILFNNVVAIAWTTYLSHACGGGAGGHAGTPRDALAAGLPCAAQAAAAVLGPHMADAARTTAAMETMLRGWGGASMPSSAAGSELILEYVRVKAELVHAACSARLPPS